jgi:hypothetical protein
MVAGSGAGEDDEGDDVLGPPAASVAPVVRRKTASADDDVAREVLGRPSAASSDAQPTTLDVHVRHTSATPVVRDAPADLRRLARGSGSGAEPVHPGASRSSARNIGVGVDGTAMS